MRIPEGATRLGRSWEGTPTYGWDNEFGKSVHKTVPAFGASEYLCSNREFYDFVQADGYKTERYWTKEGWGWVSDMKPTQPRCHNYTYLVVYGEAKQIYGGDMEP